MTRLILSIVFLCLAAPAIAQDRPLVFSTVDRRPFSFEERGERTGFSIELMQLIAQELGREVRFQKADSFSEMLQQVSSGQLDGAIANISITADRETEMDFSQPIFESGLQIMVRASDTSSGIWGALFSYDLLRAMIAAFAILFAAGMLMWAFERRKQPYFDQSANKAMFPAFWWALNLVVNGGFEERMPRSIPGRLLGVVMVISSLFVVSVFVAHITASLTVEAITGSIKSIEDLEGRRVATTEGSTASAFLRSREIGHKTFTSLAELLEAFESDTLDAVVFDGPILSHYVATDGKGTARLIERVFRPENYGIALPEGSVLREPINRTLLRLGETGAYGEIVLRWFGRP